MARRAHGHFAPVGGVGITLMVVGRPVFVASNAFSEAVDAIQYGFDEGPCVTAIATRGAVWSGTIGTGESRWPRFITETVRLGLGSVLSAPVVSGDEAIGSVNLYARPHDTFAAPDPALVDRVVGFAAGDLRHLHLQALADTAAAELATAIRDRAEVDVAVGVLMDRYVLASGPARVLLNQLARQDGVSETAAARSVIDMDGSR